MELSGATVLVTGASRGIGAACVRALGARGCRLLLSSRDSATLTDVAAQMDAVALPADLARPGAAARLAAAALEHGDVDVVVQCAGVGWYGPAANMPLDVVDEVLHLNLLAPVQLTRALLPAMLDRGRGHLSFVASVAGWTGVPREAVYSATKAGVVTFADSLSDELHGTGVGVSVVSPGAVRTDFFVRRGEPYDRRVPQLLDPRRVADEIVTSIEQERPHRMVPRWLAVAPAVRTAAPPVYRALRRRFG